MEVYGILVKILSNLYTMGFHRSDGCLDYKYSRLVHDIVSSIPSQV